MIYCNYDSLQNEFSQTYRLIQGDNEEYIQTGKHSSFYFLGKYLKQTVHVFCSEIQDENQIFYHGISEKLLVPLGTGLSFLIPLSTSTSPEIAHRFVGDKGLIMALGLDSAKFWILNPIKYCNAAWLSDFNEKECLFLQNTKCLNIKNITCPKTGCEYDVILLSLKSIGIILCHEQNSSHKTSQ
eukprot:530384_1